MSTPPEIQELTAKQKNGEKLLRRGTAVYYLAAVPPLSYACLNFNMPFGMAGGIALSVCLLVAPLMTLRGSEGWKNLAGMAGLFLAMASLGGGCQVANPNASAIGAVSLVIFILSCYIVKVFLINQDVKDYMPVLRKRRQEALAAAKANADGQESGPKDNPA